MAVKHASSRMSTSSTLSDAPTGPLVELCREAGVDHIRLPRLGTRDGRLRYVEFEADVVRLHSVSMSGGDYECATWMLRTDTDEDFEIEEKVIRLRPDLDDDEHRTLLAQVILKHG